MIKRSKPTPKGALKRVRRVRITNIKNPQRRDDPYEVAGEWMGGASLQTLLNKDRSEDAEFQRQGGNDLQDGPPETVAQAAAEFIEQLLTEHTKSGEPGDVLRFQITQTFMVKRVK